MFIGGVHAAGIGGGVNTSISYCTNIIINNGIINAYSGNLGAGIGSGYKGGSVVDNIQINGGTILAHANNAGIGLGRHGGTASNIKINGGKVTARSWYENVGIGGGRLSNLEISGGTLEVYTYATSHCQAIGGNSVDGVYITGGNVYLHSNGVIVIGTSSTEVSPTNKNNNEVLQTVLTLSGITKETPITKIDFSDYSGTYGLKNMYTRSNGKVYLYLPIGAKVVSVTAGGEKYTAETAIEAGTEGTLSK